MISSLRSLAVVVCLLALSFSPGASPARGEEGSARREWWGVVRLGGVPVGALGERHTVRGDGARETASELTLTFNRAGTRVAMSVAGSAIEDAAGQLRSARLSSRLSSQLTVSEAEVVGGQLRLRTGAGGARPAREQSLPLEGPLLGPEGVRELTLQRLAGAGDRASYRELALELGGVVAVERRLVSRGPALGATDVREIEETSDETPEGRHLWLDAQGELLLEREPSPFGALEIVRATREEAAAASSGGELPAEVYSRSFAPSSVRLPSPRDITRLRVRLLPLTPGAVPSWPALAGGSQQIVSRSADSLELEISSPSAPAGPVAALTAGEAAAPERAEYLAPNAWIESDDPAVVALAHRIVGEERDPYRRALLLTAWVHREMRFDLGIVMAPASELVRERRGTCAGYATLLAALARAVGIPARYVMGSVYLLGIWGGHAWVELEIGGRWLPFDAAVYSPGIADAARLAYARDSLRDGLGSAALAALAIYGKVRVEPVSATLGGESRDLPRSEKPYELTDDRYRNPGLGLSLAIPPGFTATRAEGVWPDPTLLELAGPGPRRAAWREGSTDGREADEAAGNELAGFGLPAGGEWRELGARRAYIRATGDRAGAVWVWGTQTLSLLVEGEGAGGLLEQLAAGTSWNR